MKKHNNQFNYHSLASVVQRAGLVIYLLFFAACVDKELRLSGEREDVLSTQRILTIDDRAQVELAGLGTAILNPEFGHPGVTSAHDGGHLSLDLP
jgi:hypothetical protein